MSGPGRTDLWSVEAPRGGVAGEIVWQNKKHDALERVRVERKVMGCDCDAPTWTSPPAEWPLKVMLHHQPGCAAQPDPGPGTPDPPEAARVVDVAEVIDRGQAQLEQSP